MLKKFGLLAGMVILWQALCTAGIAGSHLPSPAAVLRGLYELSGSGLPRGQLLHMHAFASILRVLAGFSAAMTLAVPAGLLAGWSAPVRSQVLPIADIIKPIPPLAWIPLSIFWFGLGLKAAAFIIFLGAFFPIFLNTVSGVLSVEKQLVEAARTLGAGEGRIFTGVLLPGALPSIFTGARIGLGVAWMTLIAAEFAGVRSGTGLGYMIMCARDIGRPDLIVAGMAAIGLAGYILDFLIRRVEERALSWR